MATSQQLQTLYFIKTAFSFWEARKSDESVACGPVLTIRIHSFVPCSLSHFMGIEPCKLNRHMLHQVITLQQLLTQSASPGDRKHGYTRILSLKRSIVQFLCTVILYFSTVSQAGACTKCFLTFLMEIVFVWRKLRGLCLINTKKCLSSRHTVGISHT